MSNYIYWDIETGPLPQERLLSVMPEFEAPANYKDEAKIAAYRENQKQAFFERAALSAVTGRIICIGYLDENDEYTTVEGPSEELLIKAFIPRLADILGRCGVLVGFNTHGFDIPFFVRRCWHYGITPPREFLANKYTRANYSLDLAELWGLGEYKEYISLNSLAAHLNLPIRKNGDGALFYKLYETDREAALNYLRRDLELTKLAAEKMIFAERC